MNWLSKWFGKRSDVRKQRRSGILRQRLTVEALEDRTLPTIFFVVPLTAATDSRSFFNLADAINAAGTTGDTVQIEPGSVPGSAAVVGKSLTLVGNPIVGPATLPLVDTLILNSNGNVLSNLNLSSVVIANGFTGQSISNCFAINITEQFGLQLNGNNFISCNTITGAVIMGNGGFSNPGGVGDQIVNNVFINNTTAPALLQVAHVNGVLVQGNTLNCSVPGTIGIQVEESLNATVANNTIVLTGAGSLGIVVDNSEFDTSVSVLNNRVNTKDAGIGIVTICTPFQALDVVISGNDLARNLIGIDARSNAGFLGNIDAGGGVLGSRGGNDFQGFVLRLNGAAITTTNNTSGQVAALMNIFGNQDPTLLVNGSVAVSNVTLDQGFVQRMYNNALGRSGTQNEINGWLVPVLAVGRQSVATQIIHSLEGSRHVVDRLYVKLLGRAGSAQEEAGWVNMLVAGATKETVIAGITSSQEFGFHAVTLSPNALGGNGAFVEALYLLLLNRQGRVDEINGWASAIASVGNVGVANAILASLEFRADVVQSLYFTDPNLLGISIFDTVPDLLHRQVPPAPSEVLGWANTGIDMLTLEAAIAATSEFYPVG